MPKFIQKKSSKKIKEKEKHDAKKPEKFEQTPYEFGKLLKMVKKIGYENSTGLSHELLEKDYRGILGLPPKKIHMNYREYQEKLLKIKNEKQMNNLRGREEEAVVPLSQRKWENSNKVSKTEAFRIREALTFHEQSAKTKNGQLFFNASIHDITHKNNPGLELRKIKTGKERDMINKAKMKRSKKLYNTK
ncbi:hypothetical protein EIN_498330 [Entamoeba invadens IP1]|uniref:Uncharacterized protein n=1 Tax=Entamoeba invadens IP1 TaxID=370355 RepID=A0A0A1UH42_ENTIV|nr:hypothetical protein EIN_498330 [Entamoeba invadens IP1]ELP94633.1 hypothetical protein EIN_498330 [Entamoeba invadens IP1]|eukprot:XP_004261404.1 hypothetical protein EIN_498330 [Entamoeba invadens IP1]